jgi:hypothetical protein
MANPMQTTTMARKKMAMRLICFLCGTELDKRKEHALVKTEHRKGFLSAATVMRYDKSDGVRHFRLGGKRKADCSI